MEEAPFFRLERIIGDESLKTLSEKCVLIVGCGGVGGYVVEALARSGVGNLIIVDFDKIDITNINRQIIALHSTIGQSKVDVMEQRVNDINPNCVVTKLPIFVDKDNIENVFQYKVDYLVDACDTLQAKKLIVDQCLKRKIPFISCMGTGNKLDPSKLLITDIRKTYNDPIARIMRKYIKDKKIKDHITVLSSTELPKETTDHKLGSTAFVPPSAGLLIAGYIINDFIK